MSAVKAKAISYFEALLDDETEGKFWRYFMSGYVVDPETKCVIPLPLNMVCWQAFKRAVEYKRGCPVLTVQGNKDGDAIRIKFEAVGARPEDFAAQARALGLAR